MASRVYGRLAKQKNLLRQQALVLRNRLKLREFNPINDGKEGTVEEQNLKRLLPIFQELQSHILLPLARFWGFAPTENKENQPETSTENLHDLSVSGYYPIGSEFDVLPLLSHFYGSGHKVSLPVVREVIEPWESPLEFWEWIPGTRTVPGKYNIPIPIRSESRPMWPRVMLVPGVAFDIHGRRVGYGGGFYDRTIKQLRSYRSDKDTVASEDSGTLFRMGKSVRYSVEQLEGPLRFLRDQHFADSRHPDCCNRFVAIGCAYENQLRTDLKEIEENHDQCVDALITDRRVIICREWLKKALYAETLN